MSRPPIGCNPQRYARQDSNSDGALPTSSQNYTDTIASHARNIAALESSLEKPGLTSSSDRPVMRVAGLDELARKAMSSSSFLIPSSPMRTPIGGLIVKRDAESAPVATNQEAGHEAPKDIQEKRTQVPSTSPANLLAFPGKVGRKPRAEPQIK